MKGLLKKNAAAANPGEANTARENNDSGLQPEAVKSSNQAVTNESDRLPDFPVDMLSDSKTLRSSKNFSIGQRYSEYVRYMSRFPKLLACDKNKLKAKIEEALGYEEFKNLTVKELNLSKYTGFQILDNYSVEHGISLK